MTILARWSEIWCLAGRSGAWSNSAQLSIKVGLCMPRREGFLRANNYLYRNLDSADGTLCYPEIRYGERKVHPEHWHPQSSEPLLRCHMYEIASIVVTPGFNEARTALDQEARRRHVGFEDPLYLNWVSLLRRHEAAIEKLRSDLLADGWEDGGSDGGLKKYVHVDDLEKIEGPPPEGPF